MRQTRRRFITASTALTAGLLHSKLRAQALEPWALDERPQLLRRPVAATNGTLTVSSGTAEIWPGASSSRILINQAPLVAIEYMRGDQAQIPVRNNLTNPISIHWHGLDVPSDMDGHPRDMFGAGSMKEYVFPIRNRAGLYFFHSHSHMATAREVYTGLAGIVLVRDEEELALPLPRDEYEIPIVLQDVRVSAAGTISYSPTMNDTMNGWMGDRVLANGTPNAYQPVHRGTYRLRLLNASNARTYRLQLSNGSTFTIIGTDGGLLETPQQVAEVFFSPGERLDLIVDFSAYAEGTEIRLLSAPYNAPVEMMAPTYPQGIPLDIVRFRVTGTMGQVVTLPARLCTLPMLPSDVSTLPLRSFALAMTRGMGMGMRPTINGASYDINRVDFVANANSTEVWEFRNTESAMLHPIHLHGRQFRVLSRSGGRLLPTDLGLKDTVLIGQNETVRLLVQHSSYSGLFLFHCHNLEHEDEGMMQNYELRQTTGVDMQHDASFDVGPNPATSTITVTSALDVILRLDVYNAVGHIVLTAKNVASGSAIAVDHLPAGMYSVTDGCARRLFIVQR